MPEQYPSAQPSSARLQEAVSEDGTVSHYVLTAKMPGVGRDDAKAIRKHLQLVLDGTLAANVEPILEQSLPKRRIAAGLAIGGLLLGAAFGYEAGSLKNDRNDSSAQPSVIRHTPTAKASPNTLPSQTVEVSPSATANASPSPTEAPSIQAAPSTANPTKTPTVPAPETADPSNDDVLTVGSYNLRGASHDGQSDGGEGHLRTIYYKTRAKMQRSILLKQHVDIAGTQENEDKQGKYLMSIMPKSWRMYTGPDPGAHNKIIYNSDVVKLVKESSVKVRYFGGSSHRNPLGVFKYIGSDGNGGEFALTVGHPPAETGRWHNQDAHRGYDAAVDAQTANSMASKGIPLLITNDENSNSFRDGNGRPVLKGNQRLETLPYCIRTKTGQLQYVADLESNKTGPCPDKDSHVIDRIYVTAGINLLKNGWQRITGGQRSMERIASDHFMSVARFDPASIQNTKLMN